MLLYSQFNVSGRKEYNKLAKNDSPNLRITDFNALVVVILN